MQWNGCAILCYAAMVPVKKPRQVMNTNTTGFLTIQRHKTKIQKRVLAKDNCNKLR